MTNPKTERFKSGALTLTPGTLALFPGDKFDSLLEFLTRHLSGDAGEVCEEDRKSNAEAIAQGYRVMSSFVHEGTRFWIITEADRSVTTFLLPEEY